MSFTAKPYLKQAALRSGIELDLDSYPYNIASVRAMGCIEFHADVTFFVGENGSGKSTVLEAIATALGYGPEGGTRNVQLKTTESVSSLHQALRLGRSFGKPRDGYFLRAESFFNVATYMDGIGGFSGPGGSSLHTCSHGEAFMALLTEKFRGKGLYLLDEPEAALSPTRQLAALAAIHGLVRNSSSPPIHQFCCPIPTPKFCNLTAWEFRKCHTRTPSILRSHEIFSITIREGWSSCWAIDRWMPT
jgi:predicted ATPase